MRSAIVGEPSAIEQVYGEGRRQRIAALTELHPVDISRANFDEQSDRLTDVEVILGTWGLGLIDGEKLAALPRLRAVFYGASSVQAFGGPLLERGIALYSAWQANAVFVARMTLGLVLLACKGFFQNARDCRLGGARGGVFFGPGAFDATIAILGAGTTGRALIELLRPIRLKLIVFDPFLPDAEARELGVEKVSLDQAFDRALVVSNHLAAKPQTDGLINGPLLRSMPDRATLINTGRGRTVNHAELIDTLRNRPDLTALLDVTDSATDKQMRLLRELPNVVISSHIAGAINRERLAIGDAVIEQFQQWRAGQQPAGRVTQQMLATMA